MDADNRKVLWGTGDDASILYNGTDLVINPKEVGSGDVKISGGLIVDTTTFGVDSSANKVGIGKVTSLTHTLTVEQVNTAGTNIGVKNTSDSASASAGVVISQGTASPHGMNLFASDVDASVTSNARRANITTDTQSLGVTITARKSTGDIRLYTGLASPVLGTDEAMIIDSSGDVGIGTAAPVSKLHIQVLGVTGPSVTVAPGSGALSPGNVLGNYDWHSNDASTAAAGIVGRISTVVESGFSANSAQTFMAFHTNKGNAGTLDEAMRIDSNGDVGIGTDSPDGRLHVHTATAGVVAANAVATDLVVEGSGNSGISILTPDNMQSTMMFGSVSKNNGAKISWLHDTSTLEMTIGTTITNGVVTIASGNGSTAISIDASQNVTTAKTLTTMASVSARSGLNIPHGTAPTSPVDGDMWTTTSGLFIRINGGTVGPLIQ